MTPLDHDHRLAAIDPTRSVCVTAPAGSGKTELLTQRILRLLAIVDKPEEILAITFTRKAAGEMHHRLLTALRSARDQTTAPTSAHAELTWRLAREALAHDAEKQWQLLDSPARLKVQTIDSFCGSLTQQMPVLADFGAAPQRTENAEQLYRQAVREFLARLEQPGPIGQAIAVLLLHLDNNMALAEQLLMTMLQRRDQWLLHIGSGASVDAARSKLENTLAKVISEHLLRLRACLLPFQSDLCLLLDYAASNVAPDHPLKHWAGAVELPPATVAAMPVWRALRDVVLTGTGSWRKSLTVKEGFIAKSAANDKALAVERKEQMAALMAAMSDDSELAVLLTETRCLPHSQYAETQWQLLAGLAHLLPVLVAQLHVVFQQTGTVDFSEITLAAIRALGSGLEPSDLALKLDYRLKHILIDEFQDTASSQFLLLQKLLEGWQEYNHSHSEHPNTLFIVGDGMQSIYGFREANVGLFLEARQFGVNGVPLDPRHLSVNFRSVPAVVEWVNQHFKGAFPVQDDLSRGAVHYESSSAFQHSETGEVKSFAFSGEQARQRQAQTVVELVQRCQAEDPQQSIAILVRSRAHLADIIPPLSAAGITWKARDIDPLASYSPIYDLISLLRALLDIADRISWTAVLRTPWIGLSHADLLALLAEFPDTPVLSLMESPDMLAQLSRQGREQLQRVTPLFSRTLLARGRLSFRYQLEGLWQALGGVATLRDEDDLDNIDTFLHLLEAYQDGDGFYALDDFEQAVDRLYASSANASDSTSECTLQLMTIHKSKGLEFDTVILPELTRPPRTDSKALMMWRETVHADNSQGLMLATLAAKGGDSDPIYEHLRYEAKRAAELENTRMLYVASTRAIRNLYLLMTVDCDEKTNTLKEPGKTVLVSSIWPTLVATLGYENTDDVKEELAQMPLVLPAGESRTFRRLNPDWAPPAWQFPNPLSDFYLHNPENNPGDTVGDNVPPSEWLEDNTSARAVGTVCHAILEQLSRRGIAFWQQLADQNRYRWLEQLLGAEGLAGVDVFNAALQIYAAIGKTLHDERGHWLLFGPHSESESEVELIGCFNQQIRRKIIDRTFIDDAGTRWIVDFKTAQLGESESVDEFVARECATYRQQLLDYRFYYSVKEPDRDIRCALYFTSLPRWQEIS